MRVNDIDGCLDSHDLDGSVLSNSVVKENENQNVDLLEDFDSYLDDINNRLTVSKLVSDSVTSEMLNAVESEAAEKIAEKENEISRWKEVLLLSPVGSEESGTSGSRLILEQNVESCGVESSVLEKTKEIAGLRRELDSIAKLLTGYENGGSEVLDSKISKSLGSACSVWDRNGKHIGSLALTPSKLEELKQLSCEQLINHFKNEMNEMKREHDYTIQQMTEEYFSVNRRYSKLKANGMFSCFKKDRELDALRKKIPDIILKLDKILLEDEKSVFEGKNDAYFKSQCDSLLEENLKLRESLREAEREIDLGDSCVESYMAEECCTIIYKEALKDADKKLGELNINVSEREQALRLEIVESERLKEKILLLECLVKEKENLVQIAENDLATEKEKLEIVFQQNDTLQHQIDQQAMVIQDKNEELRVISGRSLEETELCEMEISELRQKLELARKNMKIIENEKVKSDLKLSSSEAEQKRLKDQFLSIVLSLAEWSQCFDNIECSVAEKLMKTNFRLESMQSQLSDLLDEVDELKARESIYKQLMEKRTCDLQKAETEVDLLGDQIESFLDLLKKIYIALDHYSPILKHYPGVIEILKLVRRELRGESKKLSVVRTSLT